MTHYRSLVIRPSSVSGTSSTTDKDKWPASPITIDAKFPSVRISLTWRRTVQRTKVKCLLFLVTEAGFAFVRFPVGRADGFPWDPPFFPIIANSRYKDGGSLHYNSPVQQNFTDTSVIQYMRIRHNYTLLFISFVKSTNLDKSEVPSFYNT